MRQLIEAARIVVRPVASRSRTGLPGTARQAASVRIPLIRLDLLLVGCARVTRAVRLVIRSVVYQIRTGVPGTARLPTVLHPIPDRLWAAAAPATDSPPGALLLRIRLTNFFTCMWRSWIPRMVIRACGVGCEASVGLLGGQCFTCLFGVDHPKIRVRIRGPNTLPTDRTCRSRPTLAGGRTGRLRRLARSRDPPRRRLWRPVHLPPRIESQRCCLSVSLCPCITA